MGRELLLMVALLFVSTGAKPFSKYGRSCKDINCLSNERCVMAEDPCNSYESQQCGRYPTCKKADYAGNSCATMICPSGQYCRTENGKPTCVNTVPNLGYDSAGVASVNGQASNPTNHNTNINPYAPNAPPLEDVHTGGKPYSTNTASGYPAYPSNSGSNGYPSNSGSNGYPNSGRTDLGYPPYPTQNRMPVPGGQYPNYPGPPQYPYNNNNNNNKYPGNYHQNYPYNNKGGYNSNSILRRNSAGGNQASLLTLTSVLISAALAHVLQMSA